MAAGAVASVPVSGGMLHAAPMILTHGPDEVRDHYLVPTLTGEVTWCQLFSEPGAGSDLAGLTTRAERDGDEWVGPGRRCGTRAPTTPTSAMLVARTSWDVPKHAGLTYFAAADAPARCRGAAAAPDERPLVVQARCS